MKTYIRNSNKPIYLVLALFQLFLIQGCSDDFFDKQPLDAVSDATFWKTQEDAELALVGIYDNGTGFKGEDFWTPRALLYLDLMAGEGSEKELIPDRVTDGSLNPSYFVTANYWSNAYQKITVCNNFLDHLADFEIDEDVKSEMAAEVRTIRAYSYFNLGLYFGGVPLIKKVLTIDEANSVSRASLQEVWTFAENELLDSYPNLPLTRPESENGRITSGAALAILGRLQMAKKDWTAAASTYKTIIDSDVYSLASNFKGLFWESNELNPEIILSSQYQQDVYSHVLPQYLYPETYGGWHQFSPYNELVKVFECTDGKTINESSLFDSNNPYENRDPRLDYTIMISDRTKFKGQMFISRPDSDSPDRFNKYNWSGYAINKFMDEGFDGNLTNYGGNWIIIRYAEVLLSYLESKLESGEITQSLLDETINLVRSRSDVQMPNITIANTSNLRAAIRRERRVEFAFEGLRYYDILRWGTAAENLNRSFTGMKLTNDPENYDDFQVDENGYLIYQERNFKEGVNELWPIPQGEIDINPNLEQNPGY